MRSLESLLPYLLAGLGLPVPARCTLSAFMDVASQDLRDPSVILLDEIGSALEAPELDLKFWWSLRALTQASGLLAIMLSSQRSPMEQARDHEKPSPFFNIFHRMDLGPLTAPAAYELIASSPQPFASAEAMWMVEQSRRWPGAAADPMPDAARRAGARRDRYRAGVTKGSAGSRPIAI